MGVNTSAIGRLDAALRAAGIPVDGVAGSQGSVRVDYQAAATGPQRTQGASIVTAFDWSAAADTTSAAQQAKAQASAGIDNGQLQAGDKYERMARAVALFVLDEINILRAAVLHPIVSITRVTTVATVTTLDPHGLATGDPVRIVGTTLAAYNVAATATVTSTTVFTYPVAGSPVTPAVGSAFFSMGVIPATQPRTVAQIVTAIKAKITATAE